MFLVFANSCANTRHADLGWCAFKREIQTIHTAFPFETLAAKKKKKKQLVTG